MSTKLLVTIGGILWLFSIATQAASLYQFTNFDGPNSAGGTTINGIAKGGVEVGFSTDAGGNITNFVRNPNGAFTILNINLSGAMANGINVGGTVAGGNGTSAFSYNAGTTTVFGHSGSSATTAFGINDVGTIVGQYADNVTLSTPGFVDSGGNMTTLTPVSPVGGILVVNAQGINNNGLVDGFYSTATTPVIDDNTPQHGFFYNTVTHQYTLLPDPNLPNFFTIQLLGINDNDIAAGYWQDTAGDQHGLLYNFLTGTYTFLDDPSQALSNGTTITQITGINDAGQLSGFYIGADGLSHGFEATPVPEPASLAISGLALLGLAAVLRVRRK